MSDTDLNFTLRGTDAGGISMLRQMEQQLEKIRKIQADLNKQFSVKGKVNPFEGIEDVEKALNRIGRSAKIGRNQFSAMFDDMAKSGRSVLPWIEKLGRQMGKLNEKAKEPKYIFSKQEVKAAQQYLALQNLLVQKDKQKESILRNIGRLEESVGKKRMRIAEDEARVSRNQEAERIRADRAEQRRANTSLLQSMDAEQKRLSFVRRSQMRFGRLKGFLDKTGNPREGGQQDAHVRAFSSDCNAEMRRIGQATKLMWRSKAAEQRAYTKQFLGPQQDNHVKLFVKFDAKSKAQAERELRNLKRSITVHIKETLNNAKHAFTDLGHPFFSSPAFLVIGGLTTAVVELTRVMEATRKVDDAVTQMRIRGFDPNTPDDVIERDTSRYREKALRDSLSLGVGAEHLLNIQSNAVRQGLPRELAEAMPGMVTKFAGSIGKNAEDVMGPLDEGLQQLFNIAPRDKDGKVQFGQQDVFKYMNTFAALSNQKGNSADKMLQAIQNGAVGRGSELNLDTKDTLGLMSIMNSSGARTGLVTSRFMGQLASDLPKLMGKYTKDQRESGTYASEEGRLFMESPKLLGYGNGQAGMKKLVDSVQNGGLEGILKFIQSFGRVKEADRKRLIEMYGLGESGGAIIEEIIKAPEKTQKVLAEAKSRWGEADDDTSYLAKQWNEWTKGLTFLIEQIQNGFEVIEAEIGDVLKADIIVPFRDAWVKFATDLLNSDLKNQVHQSITAFINGLGFKDLSEMLNAIFSNIHGGDFTGVMKGMGEGIRAVFDDLRYAFGILAWITGNSDTQGIAKLATELLGFAVVGHALMPVLGIFGSISSVFMTLVHIGQLGFDLAKWGGLTTSLESLVKLPFAEAAAGLAALLGPLVTLVGLAGYASSKGILAAPQGLDSRSILKFLDPGLADLVYGKEKPGTAPSDKTATPAARNPYATGRNTLFHHSDWDGPDYRSMIQRTAYITEDDPVGRAIISTDQTVSELLDQARKGNNLVQLAALKSDGTSVDVGGSGSGSGGGSGGGSYGSPGSWNKFSPREGGPLGRAAGGMGPGRLRRSGGGPAPQVGSSSGDSSGRSGGSRSWRNNNPGNIEFGAFAKAHGATGSDGRFAKFPDYATGRKAQENLLFDSKGYRNLTLSQAIHRWAPASENNVPAYIAAMHGDPNAVMGSFSPEQRGKLLDAMQAHEGWRPGRAAGAGAAASALGGSSAPGNIRSKLKLDGKSFDFGTGGNHGAASIPFGDYPITPGTVGAWGQAHGALGINNNAIWDQSLGRMRTGIEMHAASSASMLSSGCIAIAKDQFAEVKARTLEMIQKTGHAYLHVGKDGASITPDKASIGAASSFGRARQILEQRTKDDVVSPASSAGQAVPTITNRAGGGMQAAVHAPIHIHSNDPQMIANAVQKHINGTIGYRSHDVDHNIA